MRIRLGALILVLACRSSTTAQQPDASAREVGALDGAGDVARADAADDADVTAPVDVVTPSTIGAECAADEAFSKGSCSPGELCAPFAGGYCVRFCERSRGCPAGSVCADSVRLGDLCLQRCADASECREGYVCDPTWQVCTPRGILSPRPPACTGSAPPRRAFGAPRMLSRARPAQGYDWEPTAALGADGRVVVAYTTRATGSIVDAPSLRVGTVRADGTLDIDRTITTPRSDHYDAWMASDARGTFHLAWLGHDGGGVDRASQIGYASSADGTTWTAPRSAHDVRDCSAVDGCLDKPMIAAGVDPMDTTRDVILVCYAASGTGLRCRRSIDRGASFERSVAVGSAFYGDLRIDRSGRVHVVMTRGPGGPTSPTWFGSASNSVGYYRSDDGGQSFREVSTVSLAGESVPMYFSNAQVVRDEARDLLYVVYPSGGVDAVWDITLATSRDGGATWSRARVNDDARCATHMTPAIALDRSNGATHVMWVENRGGAGHVAYARCESGGARCGANESVSDAPFASFALVRQSPRWLGEYHTLLVDDTRRRMHAVWTQTVSEDGAPVARIFHASAGL